MITAEMVGILRTDAAEAREAARGFLEALSTESENRLTVALVALFSEVPREEALNSVTAAMATLSGRQVVLNVTTGAKLADMPGTRSAD